jgi:hypothetical protein
MAKQILCGLAICILIPGISTAQTQPINAYAKDFYQAVVTPETIVMPVPSAAFSNYVSKPAGFGSGAVGFGYHYGVSLADNVNSKFMRKFVFAIASQREEEYKSLGAGGRFWRRVGNAAMHSLFADPSESSRSFNWSGLPASFASAALSDAYQPAQQRTWSATFARFGTNSAAYMAGDVWLEFTVKPREHMMFRTFLKSR